MELPSKSKQNIKFISHLLLSRNALVAEVKITHLMGTERFPNSLKWLC